jgi:hypothetical protein
VIKAVFGVEEVRTAGNHETDEACTGQCIRGRENHDWED